MSKRQKIERAMQLKSMQSLGHAFDVPPGISLGKAVYAEKKKALQQQELDKVTAAIRQQRQIQGFLKFALGVIGGLVCTVLVLSLMH